MEIKNTNDITILIEWKNGKVHLNDNLKKTSDFVKELAPNAVVGPSSNFRTLIKMRNIPRMELEDYTNVPEDEFNYNYDSVFKLISIIKEDKSVSAIFIQISENELAGYNFQFQDILYNVLEEDDKGMPSLIRIYPYIQEQ